MTTTVLTEGRKCPQCGKRLRADNKRGTCSACLAKPKRETSAGKSMARPSPAPLRMSMLPASQLKAQGDPVTRFKAVANALGFDGEGMLRQYAQTWLDGLSATWSKAISNSNPAPPTTKAKLVSAPVRLQPGAPESGPAADAGAGA